MVNIRKNLLITQTVQVDFLSMDIHLLPIPDWRMLMEESTNSIMKHIKSCARWQVIIKKISSQEMSLKSILNSKGFLEYPKSFLNSSLKNLWLRSSKISLTCNGGFWWKSQSIKNWRRWYILPEHELNHAHILFPRMNSYCE